MGKVRGKSRFNTSTPTQSSRFNYDPKTEVPIINHKHPIFCFKYLHPNYNIDKCDNNEKIALISQIGKLSQLNWQEIEYTSKKGLGTEKIYLNSLKVKCPSFITEDISYLIALRFYKGMPFLIYRDKFLAHIIFIDPKGKVYKH